MQPVPAHPVPARPVHLGLEERNRARRCVTRRSDRDRAQVAGIDRGLRRAEVELAVEQLAQWLVVEQRAHPGVVEAAEQAPDPAQ